METWRLKAPVKLRDVPDEATGMASEVELAWSLRPTAHKRHLTSEAAAVRRQSRCMADHKNAERANAMGNDAI
jgi:hypothetical protein